MGVEEIVTGSKFHDGRICPACQTAVREGEVLHLCPACGAASHERCWRQGSGCQSYFCRKSGKAQTAGLPGISISREDTDRLKPEQLLPATTSYPDGREGRYPKRMSMLAVAALLVVVLSGGFLGCFGLLMGAVALGMIANNSTLRGRWLAVSAIVLSVLLYFGWGLAWWMSPWNLGRQLQELKFHDSPENLKDVPEPIRGTMRANVVVRTSSRGLMGSMMIGSGVIVRLAGEGTLILTNRHVIDPKYKDSRSGPVASAEVDVYFCGGEKVSGAVRWVHPDGADLALVECRPSDLESPAEAHVKLPASAPVGAEVFAVGNPMDLGWTYTKGVISNVRELTVNGRALRVFQTQTPINEGNSGGGLYDSTGWLVGINTWTQSKGVAEGLSFAIAVEHAEEVLKDLENLGDPPPAPGAPAPGTSGGTGTQTVPVVPPPASGPQTGPGTLRPGDEGRAP